SRSSKPAQIVVGTGEPYETVEPAGVNRRRFVRVMLQNNTDTEIANGRLGIVNLDPANGGVSDCELKSDITIGPRGRCFAEVACYDIGSSQAKPGMHIRLVVPMVGGFFAEAYAFANLPLQEHTFHLRFSRFTEVFDEVFCALYLDSSRVLHLEDRGDSSKSLPVVTLPDRSAPTPVVARDRRASSLKMSVDEAGAYFETRGRSTRHTERTLKLKLENTDRENAVTDVKVAIMSIEPQTEYVGPWILKSGFALAAGADEFIPLASFGEPYAEGSLPNRYGNTDSFFVVLTTKNQPSLPKETTQFISLRATGLGAAASDFKCKLWVDRSDGRLRISEASQDEAVH
ncbi:MAG: hypothetical protein P4L81_00185, partial [Candidatus Pacebacteria bacterium]|nr:hypothetical protein [Candidatus Paceibacterota bacterium]